MSQILGMFHPDNNLGVEIFCVGVVLIWLFLIVFFVWLWWQKRKEKKVKVNESS